VSEENVELLRGAIEAWNSDGIEAMLRFYPEDVIWHPFPDAPIGRDGLKGHEEIRGLMADWVHGFADFAVATEEVRDLGDRVLWLGVISGTIKGSDVPVRQPIGGIAWDFRDGMIGRSRFLPSWEATLEAAGVSR
jgi:ketosteroid isomerase-like protein